MRCISAMYLMADEPGELADGDIFAPVAEPLAVAAAATDSAAVDAGLAGLAVQRGYQLR